MSFLNSAGLFNVVPDSELDHRWRMDEGSGTALADSVGSESASLTGAGWQSDANATGGFWTTYDATNDYGQTDSPIGCNNDQFTVMMWFEWTAPSQKTSLDSSKLAGRAAFLDRLVMAGIFRVIMAHWITISFLAE